MNGSTNLRFKVFVGFGGAGGKTLAHLAELLAQDYELGAKADREYLFLLIDTNQGDLQEAERRIRGSLGRYCGDGEALVVELLGLGRALNDSFAETVIQTLSRGGPTAKQRFRDCWWHDDSGHPLSCKFLHDPEIGAGEMPLTSRFMAWRNVNAINDLVEALTKAMYARARGEQFTVDLYFVSGLAGGTGRGCWSLLGLKFREVFKRKNITCFPLGVFFDATCFHWLRTELQPRLKVNALTGISELVMWLKNDRLAQKKLYYQLPDLDNPDDPAIHAVDSSRCLHVPPESGGQVLGASPVDAAFLIFASSSVAYADEGDFYYRMAGTGLYATVRGSSFLSQISNLTDRPLMSFGSALCAVPANEIYDFARRRAREIFCRQLIQIRPEAVQTTQQTLTQLLAPEAILDQTLTTLAGTAGALRQYRAAIGVSSAGTQRPEDAIRFAGELERENSAGTVDALLECLRDVYRLHVPQAPAHSAPHPSAAYPRRPEEFLTEIVVNRVAQDLGAGSLQLAEAQALLERMAEWFKQAVQPDDGTLGLIGSSSGDSGPGELAALTKELSTRKLILFGEAFDEDERRRLQEAALNALKRANRATAQAQLREAFIQAARRCLECANLLREIVEVATSLAKDHADTAAEARRHLFLTREDGEYTQLAPPGGDIYDVAGFVWRPLKPNYTEEVDQEIQLQLRGSDRQTNALNTRAWRLWQEAVQETARALHDEARAEGELRADLKYDLREIVRGRLLRALENVAVSEDFVQKNFSLDQVVRGLRTAWQEALQQTQDPERRLLAKHFEQVFGFVMDPSSPPSVETMLAELAANIAATCQPFFLSSRAGGDRERDQVELCLPSCNYDPRELERLIRASRSASRVGLTDRNLVVRIEDPKLVQSSGYNPFSIVAFCFESFPDWKDPRDFGGVRSVEYWATAEGVKPLLDAAERKDSRTGNLVFGHPLLEKGGVGYLDPAFVHGPWREFRWKPWCASQTAENLQAKLFAYMIMGNLPPNTTNPVVTEVLARLAAQQEWRLPLVTISEAGWVWTRRGYGPDRGTGRHREIGDHWNPNARVCLEGRKHSSLKTVIEWLQRSSPAILADLEWEMKTAAECLRAIELRTNEWVELLLSQRQLLVWLRESAEGRFEADDLLDLKAFLREADEAVDAQLAAFQKK